MGVPMRLHGRDHKRWMMREGLLRLKGQAEAEKLEWIKKIDDAEKTLAQINAQRQELIGRANQAVGAIAAIEKLLEAENIGDAVETAIEPLPNRRRGQK